MAAKDDGERLREGDERIVDLALRASCKGTGKGKWSFGMGQNWDEKGYQGGKGGKDEGKNPWQTGSGKKGNKGQERSGKGETKAYWT